MSSKEQTEAKLRQEGQDPAWNEKQKEAFWQSCYGRWLHGCALRLNAKVQTLGVNKWGTRCKPGEAKTYKLVLERKEQFRDKCIKYFGQIVPKGLPHIFEAGGVPDFVRFSITCDSVSDMRETLDEMLELKLATDGLEVVSVVNGFHVVAEDHCYKDVKVGVIASLPEGILHIVEVQLIIKKYLQIRLHRYLFQTYENGDYVDANYKMRQGCANRVASVPKDKSSKRKVAASAGENKRRFEVNDILWCWESLKGLGAAGHLLEPTNSESLVTGMLEWKEVNFDSRLKEASTDVAMLVKATDPKEKKLDTSALNYLFNNEGIQLELGDMERIQLEINSGDARLFRNGEGRLHIVREMIIMRMLGQGGDEVLWRESPPDVGFPKLQRRCHEELDETARRLINVVLPPCLRGQGSVALCDFDASDGTWLTYDEAGGIGTLPAATRHYVFKGVLGEEIDPFVLVALGLNE